MEWLLTKGQFTLSELHELKFSSKVISSNVNSFLKNVIQKCFGKRSSLVCKEVLVCKEDKELVTKSQIVVIINMLSLLNLSLTAKSEDKDL